MPGENLTRDEAIARAELIEVENYHVEITVTDDPHHFRSRTRVTFRAREGASTFIDAISQELHEITLNGTALDPAQVSDGVRIQLDNLQFENELLVDGLFNYTNTGEGLHRFVDPVDDHVYLYTQFEVPDSRRMFAVFEQPDLKATFDFVVNAPQNWIVTSNEHGEVIANDGDNATWVFARTPRISSYITALVAGPYKVVRSELTSSDGRTIPLGVFCRESLFEYLDADYIFAKTREGFTYYEKHFDVPYPFTKYDQLFVPEFNAGAMENAGCVTFTETYVFRSKVTDAIRERRVVTILHELAHMWFGDLVTMRWWNDLWLNESFAEFASTLATADATEWHNAWTTFAVMEKSWAYRQDQLPSTHPIVANIPDLDSVRVNFDGITYAKGGSVLKQLVAWVDQHRFMAGVSNYFKQHAFGNTELKDLLHELEKTSGRDLSTWSKLWLETAGVNTLRPLVDVDAEGVITSFAIEQTAPADWPTIRPHRMAIGFYNLDGGAGAGAGAKVVRSHRVELDVDGKLTAVDELVGLKRPDLILINDDDLTYAKIRLDEASTTFAIAHLKNIADPLARALIWGSVWDATRDAETPARDFIDLVLANIDTENESTVVRTVLGQLLSAATLYVDPSTRQAQTDRIADALWQLAKTAEAGSDNQFQFVRNFAQVANTSEQLDVVARLRSGEISLEGLDIDTDLGWELLICLAAGGRASAGDIDEYLATDNTATGRQSAAHARAALPTVDDKQRAWDSVFVDDSQPNLIVRATGLGFSRANDPQLLAPFEKQYFEAIERIWAERSYAIAEELIESYYPATLANQPLADATRAFLDTRTLEPPLKRLIVENLAGVERALRAQNCDAQAG